MTQKFINLFKSCVSFPGGKRKKIFFFLSSEGEFIYTRSSGLWVPAKVISLAFVSVHFQKKEGRRKNTTHCEFSATF